MEHNNNNTVVGGDGSSPPGNFYRRRSPYYDFLSPSSSLHSPGFGHVSSETLESAFSRLNMLPDHHQLQTPPPPPMVPFQGGGGGGGGGGQDLSFIGTHLDSVVGPGSSSSWVGVGPSSTSSNDAVCWDCCRQNFPNHDFEPFTYPQQQPPLTAGDLLLNHSNFVDKSAYSSLSRVSKQYHSLSFLDFKGRIVALARDENWSRIFQELLEEDNRDEQEIEMVVCQVIYNVADLMMDEFGCHFMHKLFAVCSEEQRTSIIVAITRDLQFLYICLDPYGAKIMPKLLKNLSNPEQISFVVSALRPEVVRLSTDPNGQHVMRFCLQNFPYEFTKSLFIEIKKNCFYIATDKSGCCLLQCCLDCAQGNFKQQLIREIISNSLQLATDPYGNYVIQFLLGKKEAEKTNEILEQLRGYFVSLSRNKHGSHVVEKFLNDADKEHTDQIILELLRSPVAASLLVDPFGNFVIQKALSVAKGPYLSALCKFIEANDPYMRGNLYGSKVLAWIREKECINCRRLDCCCFYNM